MRFINTRFRAVVLWALIILIPTAVSYSQNLEIHIINVGQGSSELIIGPNGTTILIDGGTSTYGNRVKDYLELNAPSYQLDYMIASHDDSDHYGGLNWLLQNTSYNADQIYHCGENYGFGRGTQIPLGKVIELGNGATATCVGRYGQFVGNVAGYANSKNNRSVSLLIEYGGFDYITAGDLESNEYWLFQGLLAAGYLESEGGSGVDVIHVNHHGSDGSSKYYYINALKHELAVINGGTGYGHPRWTAVDRLKGRLTYSDGSGSTGVTWTGCSDNVFRTTYASATGGRAPEWDCPTLGDMVITYPKSGPDWNYYTLYGEKSGNNNNNPFYKDYRIDEELPSTPTPPPAPTPVAGPVVINEILACLPRGTPGDANGDGVRGSWEDEFVELVNRTDRAIHLGGWSISDSSYARFIFPDQTWIPGGGSLILFGGGNPTGDFGGAVVLTAGLQSTYGLGLTDKGDTVTLAREGYIYDRVSYGEQTRSSITRDPETTGEFFVHRTLPRAMLAVFSPGKKVNRNSFERSAGRTDYDGDGTGDLAIFRPSSGLWAVKGVTRTYFGRTGDLPVPGDYDGDGTTDPAVFRESSGLWAVRGVTRAYFGSPGDLPLPDDYSGRGSAGFAIYRKSSGLWAIRGVTRVYFGSSGDTPVPDDYDSDGLVDIGIFRPSSGLWAVRGVTRTYFGSSLDTPLSLQFNPSSACRLGIFRGSSGLWAFKDGTRAYFGRSGDLPVPGDYNGDGIKTLGIFRGTSGLWAIRGVTRAYFGTSGDVPVTR